jgi:hypothetical protein
LKTPPKRFKLPTHSVLKPSSSTFRPTFSFSSPQVGSPRQRLLLTPEGNKTPGIHERQRSGPGPFWSNPYVSPTTKYSAPMSSARGRDGNDHDETLFRTPRTRTFSDRNRESLGAERSPYLYSSTPHKSLNSPKPFETPGLGNFGSTGWGGFTPKFTPRTP